MDRLRAGTGSLTVLRKTIEKNWPVIAYKILKINPGIIYISIYPGPDFHPARQGAEYKYDNKASG
jgi:hypothetical protein